MYGLVCALGKKTPLEHAVSGGNLPAVRFLLDHGADLHQESEQGATVLHLAAMKGTLRTGGNGLVTDWLINLFPFSSSAKNQIFSLITWIIYEVYAHDL